MAGPTAWWNPFDGDVVPGVNVNDKLLQAAGNPYRGPNQNGLKDLADTAATSLLNGVTGKNYNPGWLAQAGTAEAQSGFNFPTGNGPTTGGNDNVTGDMTGQPNINGIGGGGQVGDAATAAYYDDAIRSLESQLGRLDSQQLIGLENILNSYNRSQNRLHEQRGIAERDYGTSKDRNVNSYLGARNGILQNTRATANSLQRLLGLGGAGYSSAALESAPYAAALQGSQNLSGAQRTYGDNEASLATAWGDTERGFKNSMEDLDTQRFQQENNLRSSIAQTRASLLDRISQGKIQSGMARGQNYASAAANRGSYQSQIDGILDEITGYGRQYANPVLNTGNVQYKAPTQAQFSLDKFAAPAPASSGAQSDLSPTFLGLLTGQQGDRDEFGNLIGY